MSDVREFNEGIEFGARGVIDLFETRLYYMPSTWKTGDGAYIIDIMEKTIETAKRIFYKNYEEGVDNGEES